MLQFGIKEPGREYVDRPSVYVVLLDGSSRILAVWHDQQYFLPGGGIEPEESLEQALYREMAEEVGWTVRLIGPIGDACQYLYVPKDDAYINKIGRFFLGEILDMSGANSEEDHEARWLTFEEFEVSAAHESHVWAARRALAARSESNFE